jgi:hypothetical protein
VKSTNDMLNNMKREMKYLYFSKILLITLIATIAFSGWNLFLQMKQTQDQYDLYLRTEAEFKKDGIDIEEALRTPANVEMQQSSGSQVAQIDNVLRYDYDNLAYSLYLMNPNHVVSQTLEWMTFMFFPFIFAMFGIYLATYDRKFRTIKIRAVQTGWKTNLLSKQLSMYISSTLIVSISLLTSYIIGMILYQFVVQDIPANEFKLEAIPESHNIFLQYFLSLFICFIFSTLGFYLGTVLKGFMAPTLIFVVYNFIIPILGKFDIRNMLAVLGHKVFDFKGRVQLFIPTEMSLSVVFISLVVLVVLSTAITYFVSEKQTKYVI